MIPDLGGRAGTREVVPVALGKQTTAEHTVGVVVYIFPANSHNFINRLDFERTTTHRKSSNNGHIIEGRQNTSRPKSTELLSSGAAREERRNISGL